MHVIVCICECEFGRNSFKGGRMQNLGKFELLQKKKGGGGGGGGGKHGELAATIQVENLEVFYISDDETDLIVGFVTQNLVV